MCYIVIEPNVPLDTRLDGKVWWHGVIEHQNPIQSVESAGGAGDNDQDGEAQQNRVKSVGTSSSKGDIPTHSNQACITPLIRGIKSGGGDSDVGASDDAGGSDEGSAGDQDVDPGGRHGWIDSVSAIDGLGSRQRGKRPPSTPQRVGKTRQSNTDEDITPRKGKKKKKQKSSKAASAIALESYFDQKEARNLLAPKSPNNMPVSEALEIRKVSQYTLNGPQDIYGSIDKNFNLIYLMTQQYDFAHESTMLQHIGNELGVIVDRTPKCHPEMAGEGIEYSWGCAKNRYRALPLAEKKSKAKFLENVRLCMSRDYITAKGWCDCFQNVREST